MARRDLRARVRRVAEELLNDRHYVAPVDVLLALGWLAPSHMDRWRQGRAPSLEREVQAGLGKISTAMVELRRWAIARGLTPSETAYVARTRDRRHLRFSVSGDPGIERAYRTHWVSPELSERKQQRLAEKQSTLPELVVIAARRSWRCADCGEEFAPGAMLIMEDEGPHCLGCRDLDQLEYVPAGNAKLTRRVRKLSEMSAVVVEWSRTRRRYERQGILAGPDAVRRAEAECLSQEEVRERRLLRGDPME